MKSHYPIVTEKHFKNLHAEAMLTKFYNFTLHGTLFFNTFLDSEVLDGASVTFKSTTHVQMSIQEIKQICTGTFRALRYVK